MIYNEDCTLPEEYLKQLSAEGMEALPEMIRVLINQAMQIERTKHIHATPYERKEERSGHSNGFKPKTVKTRMGEITFAVPQVRVGGAPTLTNRVTKSVKARRIEGRPSKNPLKARAGRVAKVARTCACEPIGRTPRAPALTNPLKARVLRRGQAG